MRAFSAVIHLVGYLCRCSILCMGGFGSCSGCGGCYCCCFSFHFLFSRFAGILRGSRYRLFFGFCFFLYLGLIFLKPFVRLSAFRKVGGFTGIFRGFLRFSGCFLGFSFVFLPGSTLSVCKANSEKRSEERRV